jgi:hypothetical protein
MRLSFVSLTTIDDTPVSGPDAKAAIVLFIGPGIVIGGCESYEKAARVAEAASKPTSRIDLDFSKMRPLIRLFDYFSAMSPPPHPKSRIRQEVMRVEK